MKKSLVQPLSDEGAIKNDLLTPPYVITDPKRGSEELICDANERTLAGAHIPRSPPPPWVTPVNSDLFADQKTALTLI